MKLKFKHPELKEELTGPKYWRSLDELADKPEFKSWLEREFPEGASESDGMDRRHFMKLMAASFAFAGLGLSGCRQPEQKILPYAKQPERIVPGVPIYYSTSMPSPKGNIPLIVETHDARPTKVEGNSSYGRSGGSTDIFAQASILDLYDPDRSQKSTGKNNDTLTQGEVFDLFKNVYEKYSAKKGEGLAFLAEQSTSPTRMRVVAMLKEKFPQATWAEYEPVDHTRPEKAFEENAGTRLRPNYNFENAKRVLFLDANSLHGDPGHLGYSRDYAKARRVKSADDAGKMSRLYSAESNFTLTGGLADHRIRVATSHMPVFAGLVAAKVLELAQGDEKLINVLNERAQGLEFDKKWVEECARDLFAHRGESLIVAGSHLPADIHLLVAAANQALEADGNTISYLELPKNDAESIVSLAEKIQAGGVGTLIILGGNPAYNAPADLNWESLQNQVAEVIRYGYFYDETSKLADFHIAGTHYLESWGDGQTWDGVYVPVQPMILPLFEGLSELEVLARLAGDKTANAHELVKETFEQLHSDANFDGWLAKGLIEDEVYSSVAERGGYSGSPLKLDVQKLTESLLENADELQKLSVDNLEVRFVESNQVGDGRYNNNGWLQECPDPLNKLAWDNAICISPRLAKELTEKTGIGLLSDLSVMNKIGQASVNANLFSQGKQGAYLAEVTVGGKTVRGPLHIQPGLANYTLVMPLGYGRKVVGRVGEGTGFDAYPLKTSETEGVVTGAKIKVLDENYLLANTQEHWSMEGRAIIREASADDYSKHPDFVNKMGLESHSPPVLGAQKNDPLHKVVKDIPRGGGLYKTPDFTGAQQWGMSIDLNTCTGCNACVVACQSENNIAIVGKDQVLRGREMHWIRLDRYYSDGGMNKTELPEDPQVSFMGMTCQHCELAPCETVCPVNATVHDEEGLNVMAYNRCVGTRYCANNCPYKVRRFNFFDWNKRKIGHFYEGPMGPSGMPELHKMQKNPDVTVRMRGVMEKCTYCVQRIEEAKINQRVKAKDSNDILVKDGTIQTACQQVCPTDSIVFGDVADPTTEVYKLKTSDRDYSVLGYLNTRPRTTYLAKLRNPNPRMPDYYAQPLTRAEYEHRYGHHSGSHAEHVEHENEVSQHEG